MAKQATNTEAGASKLKFKSADEGSANLGFISLNKLNAGDIAVTGTYIGKVANPMTKKDDFKFEEVDMEGNATGKTIIINGAGNLGYRMSSISLGELVQVVYLGKAAMTKGPFKGTLAHSVDVLRSEN
jgi:hypothetical protein